MRRSVGSGGAVEGGSGRRRTGDGGGTDVTREAVDLGDTAAGEDGDCGGGSEGEGKRTASGGRIGDRRGKGSGGGSGGGGHRVSRDSG